MAVQSRRAWFQPMARQAAPVPVPAARPAATSAQAPRPAAPSAPAPRPPIVQPALPSQTQKPNPPPPLAAASPQRSPVAPPAQALPTTPKSPVPSTPPRSPFAPQPLVNISPSASKSPTIPKPIATAIRNGLVPGQAAFPASSPKIAKPLGTTPVQSLKTKPVSRPPPPLTLPPAQIKTESAHETISDPRVMLNTHGDGEKLELKKDKVANKKLSDSEEGRMSVITLAGENKGAILEFSPSPKIDYSAGNPHSLHETISIKDGSDGEQSSIARSTLVRYKDKFNKAKAMPAIININFLGVNNAILHDRTFSRQDPGNGTGGSGIH